MKIVCSVKYKLLFLVDRVSLFDCTRYPILLFNHFTAVLHRGTYKLSVILIGCITNHTLRVRR